VRRFQLSGALVATTARSPSSQTQTSVLFVKADIGISLGVHAAVTETHLAGTVKIFLDASAPVTQRFYRAFQKQ